MYEIYSDLLKKFGVRNIDVSRATGIPPSTFSDWKKGKSSPKTDKLQKIADYFNVSLDYLASGEPTSVSSDYKKHSIGAARRIPVLGRVAAGIPIDAITDIVDWEEIPEDMTGEYFALQIKGDSMEPKISDGDVVIVRQQDDAESGDTVIVTVNGDDATCKRLKKYSEGIALVSNNPAYEPMIFSRDDIESKPIRILGRVVELRAKF